MQSNFGANPIKEVLTFKDDRQSYKIILVLKKTNLDLNLWQKGLN